MKSTATNRRVDALVAHLLESLADAAPGDGRPRVGGAAGRANLNRTHASRAFLRATGETPAAFRRRLALERAAWRLRVRDGSVTDVAQEAGFESVEAFARAFRRAYGTAPSLFRRTGLRSHLLPAPSGIHFQPTGAFLPTEDHMDILDHLLAFDEAFVREALKRARALPPGALDRPLGEARALSFEAPDRTLRDLLDKLVFNKEVWVAAVRGGDPVPEDRDRDLDGLEARLERAFPAFHAIAREVNRERRWRETFVDTLCEPPEPFAYGGMIAHVLTVDAHRRHVLSAWLWTLGVRLDADPILFGGPSPARGDAAEVAR